jgi:hypothetical protein
MEIEMGVRWSWGGPIPPDPIFYDKGWYFFNETWTETYGPFKTRAAANKELHKYVGWLENA